MEIEKIEEHLRKQLDRNISMAKEDSEGEAKDFIGYMTVHLDDMKAGLEEQHPDF